MPRNDRQVTVNVTTDDGVTTTHTMSADDATFYDHAPFTTSTVVSTTVHDPDWEG